ncbi:MAG: NHL repeat-containing protein, partial [Actinomycetota bacterium]|nr:NHL repeat-containing protein [Actinomycetota bacterium]
ACPGGTPSCPYVDSAQIGQRGGGVLRFPQTVSIGPDGSVYVGDQSSHIVQVFSPAGTFLREIGIAGSKPGELSAVGALVMAPDNTLFVADGKANRISRFDAGGWHISSFGHPGRKAGEFHFGAGGGNTAGAGGGLAVAGNRLFVSDSANDRVQRFALDGSGGAEIVPPGFLAYPRGLTVHGTRLVVADDQNHRLVVLDQSGRFIRTVGKGPGRKPRQLNFPYGVAIDKPGRVFVADDMNQRIVRYGPKPKYKYKARWGSYGTAPGRLAFPRAIAVDAAGLVYVTNTGNDRVDVFNRSGRLQRSFGASGRSPGNFNHPIGVAADASGMRAVADSVNGRIQFLRQDGTIATVWGSPNPGPTIILRPVAVAFDAAGDAYVLDQRRAKIFVFDRATGLPKRTIGRIGHGAGELLDPYALAIDAKGTIHVADTNNKRIARFSTGGAYLGAQTGTGLIRGVAVSPDGARTYVAQSRNRITVYDPSGNVIRQFGGSGASPGRFKQPAHIALDAAENVWVADRGNDRIQKFAPDGTLLLMFGERGTGPGQFVRPTSVSIACNGLLTVADRDNNRIQQFRLSTPAAPACRSLPALGDPPRPKTPTLPSPPGPLVSVKKLRTTKLFTLRKVALRIGCDTACRVTVTGTVSQRSKPRGKRKRATVSLRRVRVRLDAAHSRIVRLGLSRGAVRRLRRALGGSRRLIATLQITARSPDGEPTELSKRLRTLG